MSDARSSPISFMRTSAMRAIVYNWQWDGIETLLNDARMRYFMRYAIVPQKGRQAQSSIRALLRARALTRAHAPPVPPARRLIIEISHVERACLWSRSARAPRNATSAWCIHAGPRIQVRPAYKRKSGRALSPGSRRSRLSPRTSPQLQNRSVRKNVRKKIRNIRNVTLSLRCHHGDFG